MTTERLPPMSDTLTGGSSVGSITLLPGESMATSAMAAEQGLTVRREAEIQMIDSPPVQQRLPGLGEDSVVVERKRLLSPKSHQVPGDLLTLYDKRIAARWTKRTNQQYRWVIRSMLTLAGNLAGRNVDVLGLLRDGQLLGQVLATATSPDGKRLASASHMAQRRSALRSFIEIMEPELRREGMVDAGDALVRALRSVAEPVGTGFRLPVGTTRRRGGPTPSIEEVAAIKKELSSKPDWHGFRNEAIFALMNRRGLRIGSILTLDGANVHKLRDGSIRCFLKAKSKREPYQLVVPDDLIELLTRYVEHFNTWAKAYGLSNRIGFGVPGCFWRNGVGHPLTYRAWTSELKQACVRAGVPIYTSHAFRRAFATNSIAVVSRPQAACVGNWSSTRLMDDSYCHPSLPSLRQSVAKLPSRPGLGFPPEADCPVLDAAGARP